jgi:ribosomal protein S18 acetylase RimI-like enzyme
MAAAFRTATADDLDAILAHVRDYYAADGYAFDVANARSALAALAVDATLGRLWVADDGGAVVGYLAVCFGWSIEHGGRDAFVDELYLAPSHRGCGLGGAAMAVAEEACAAAGVRSLHLEVERENAAGRALYARRGFAERGRILMTKRLTRPR